MRMKHKSWSEPYILEHPETIITIKSEEDITKLVNGPVCLEIGTGLGDFILGVMLVFLSAFVVAWGYQVFWNEVVLNVWQMFTSGDVINTMRISYGACLAIAIGLGLIYQKKGEEKTIKEASTLIIVKSIARIIMISLTLLVTSIVF